MFESEIAKFLFKNLFTVKEWFVNKDSQISTVIHESDSFFVNNQDLMQGVYEIRDSIFGTSELSGNSYDVFLDKNPYAIKIISFNTNDQKVLEKLKSAKKHWAYYSIIPVSENTYQEFITDQKEHKEVIHESLSWEEALGMDKVFIYLVGIVVRQGLWSKDLKSFYAIADMVDMLGTIIDELGMDRIGGVCGYPSREEGLNLFERRTHAFKYTGFTKGDSEIQKIFTCEGKGVEVLNKEIEDFRKTEKYKKYKESVYWNDRLAFLETLDPGSA